MIRYFKRSFIRYLAYGLAIALLSFIFGIFSANAETITLGAGDLWGNNTIISTLQKTDVSNGLKTYYRYYTSNTLTFANKGPYFVNIWGLSEIDTKDYDYMLMDVCSTKLMPTTIIFHDNWAMGYAQTTSSLGTFTVQSANQTIVSEYTYCTTFKVDLSNSEYLRDGVQIQFDSLFTTITGYELYINKNVILGKNNAGVQNSLNEINSSINNDNVSDAENSATGFFNSFSTDNHGLTGIISAPLSAIASITSATCSPLVLPLPFVDENLTLPCMRPIYEEFFGDFMSLYDIVVLGIVSYWIIVRIFSLVKDFKNPEHDEVEVMEL